MHKQSGRITLLQLFLVLIMIAVLVPVMLSIFSKWEATKHAPPQTTTEDHPPIHIEERPLSPW